MIYLEQSRRTNSGLKVKRLLISISFSVIIFLTCSAHVLASGLSTSGQGDRALGMGGTFTAIADDSSAIYYNPAGLTQIKGSEIMVGAAYGSPVIKYETPAGDMQKSTKTWAGGWLFATHSLTNKFSSGLGIYRPYSKEAEFSGDAAKGFLSQRAEICRTDISPVLAYEINQHVSISGGPIFGYSKIDQSIPAGPFLRIDDEMDGWGVGGIGGVLVTPNKYLKLGLTYRTRMDTDYQGRREMVSPAGTLEYDAEVDGRWPASLSFGIALFPHERLKLALDANWTGWSYIEKVVTRTEELADSTTMLEQKDTLDFRTGGEWEFLPAWFFRGGYGYIRQAVPSRWIIPARPDGDGHVIDIGIGRSWAHWKIDVLYEYVFTETLEADDNAYGYTGDYRVDQQTFAVSAAYSF